MKRIILLLTVLLLFSCNNIFDCYGGDDLYIIENGIYNRYPDCYSVVKTLNEDKEKQFMVYDSESILSVEINLWSPTGNRFDWYVEYVNY